MPKKENQRKENQRRARVARALGLLKRGQPVPSWKEMKAAVGKEALAAATDRDEEWVQQHAVGYDDAQFAPYTDQELRDIRYEE